MMSGAEGGRPTGRARGGACRLVLGLAFAGLVAGCGATPTGKRSQFPPSEWGVKASPRVVEFGQPAPRGGGREVVGKTYSIKGRTYEPVGYGEHSETGVASWYGRNFHGRRTANGEIYDVAALSAAHPTLPLPSYARVTNLGNGRSVIVRINDRGPYLHRRVIDVSERAAELLAMKDTGTARVRVDYVGPARMDGMDEDLLEASYRGPAATTQVASRGTGPAGGRMALRASLSGDRSGRRERARGSGFFGSRGAPVLPADFRRSDPLGQMIDEEVIRSSYASPEAEQPALTAISELALGDHDVGGTLTGANARQAGALVQIGVFASRANAEAIARRLGRHGTARVETAATGDRVLHVVRIEVADGEALEQLLAAAADAGAPGARRVR